ncbi:guanine deaminase [Segniliparus rugosus]|uniref:Guanine deaminase n=1 Tax=Segniliparus rugosus (strain ATCC BAA-974 / DSM 45345 / CCUG 50838 / CIP 108380 / JCM 13579 / CDC 945) TaxID=679197 RepID=E5XV13_SEGRC|nr:guanine deaminase [Segniliparus rugosus]EFV11849.1 guanine deaminase [Segniliparus rugosus ATCC BAA-974]
MSIVRRGHILHVSSSATLQTAREHLISVQDGALAVDDGGRIVYSGPYSKLPQELRTWAVRDHRPAYLIPGLVDTHVHFPQTHATGLYGGGQLLEWLDRHIFPIESRFSDPNVAGDAAWAFCSRRIAVGTTTALVFGSAFPSAQNALFAATHRRGLRMICGRTIQTVGPPTAKKLVTSEAEALSLTREEIARWHAKDTGNPATALLHVAITPRFALSVTPKTLAELGDLYHEARGSGVYFQTHFSENNRPGVGEVDSTKRAFQTDSYLDVYDGKFLPGSRPGGLSFLGPRAVLAHTVHATDAELARIAETGTAISHCPTSQLFLGSGTMPWRRTTASGATVALGSDIGGGDEWLLTRVLNDCYKVHMNEPGEAGIALHPAELLYTATVAGAKALCLDERIGSLDVGKEADFLVVRTENQPWLHELLERVVPKEHRDLEAEQLLFSLIMGLKEQSIDEVYVRGRLVS